MRKCQTPKQEWRFEVSSEDDSIPPPMKEKTLGSVRQMGEDYQYKQQDIVWHAEVNSCSSLPRVSDSRDVDEK